MKAITRIVCGLVIAAGILPAPTFNLTTPERKIVRSWLFEPYGYLDITCRASDGMCARQAWEQNSGIDITQWVRSNPQIDAGSTCTLPGVPCSQETAMLWWMLANDQVNIPRRRRPAESAVWSAILTKWDETITTGLARAPASFRNQKSQTTYSETSCPVGFKAGDSEESCVATGSVPSGAHLSAQQRMVSGVRSVIE